MNVGYHPAVQKDVNRALGRYDQISARLGDEFWAELTMWYFGTHGDLGMTGPKPENGRDGLKKYDPEAFALMDDFYSGNHQGATQATR